MGAQTLSSRAIIGEFYRTLEQDPSEALLSAISMLFQSDQDGEDYKWLGMAPQLQEWVGGRNAKGFRENGLRIENRHFESTIEVLVKELRRDKTGQVMIRIQELAERTNSHWLSLITTLVINGESNVCYDGQFFFDTDHAEGDSGTQSNDISVDISALPVEVATGLAAAPSNEQMQHSIFKGITQIAGFLDDQGEPMNETAQNFLVMVPTSLAITAHNAVTMPRVVGPAAQGLLPTNLNVSIAQNARLSAWTDKFAVFRTDGRVKPFIRQEETAVSLKAKAEGSEYEFDNDAHQYGVDTWRNVGYGYWQHSCLVTMV